MHTLDPTAATPVRRRAMSTTPADSPVAQLALPPLLALFLIPGVLLTGAYVLLAPVAEAAGFPPLAALLAAIVVVLVPVELGIVLWAGRGDRRQTRDLLPYRRPLRIRAWLALVPLLIVAGFVGFGLSMTIEPLIIERAFGWLPAWFVHPVPLDGIGSYSRQAWVVTLTAYLVLNGLVGPIVEETYFRGFLLPRMAWMGRWAPLVNVTLFSLYHLWSPWQVVGRILGFGPTVYAVRRTENIYMGMVVHGSLNTLGSLTLIGLILGQA